MASCKVELSCALVGGLKSFRSLFLRRFFDLVRDYDIFDHSIAFYFVLLDQMCVVHMLFAKQYLPVLRVMLDDFIEIFMIFLLQVAKMVQILKRNLMDRLRQLLFFNEALHHSTHALSKRLQVVPSLQHAKHWLVELLQSSGHVVVWIRSDSEAADWIVPCRIEAAGNEQELRLEWLDDWMNDPVIEVDVLVIAGCLKGKLRSLLRMVVQRNVELCAFACTDAAVGVICALTSWIVCTVVVPVHRNKENVGIFSEDVMGAVSLMHIVIQDEYLLDRISLLQITSSDCDVIEDTKAIDCVLCSWVVSGWSNECKSIVPASTHHVVDSVEHSTCRQACDSLGLLVEICIQYGDVRTMRGLRPQGFHISDVLFGICQP